MTAVSIAATATTSNAVFYTLRWFGVWCVQRGTHRVTVATVGHRRERQPIFIVSSVNTKQIINSPRNLWKNDVYENEKWCVHIESLLVRYAVFRSVLHSTANLPSLPSVAPQVFGVHRWSRAPRAEQVFAIGAIMCFATRLTNNS